MGIIGELIDAVKAAKEVGLSDTALQSIADEAVDSFLQLGTAVEGTLFGMVPYSIDSAKMKTFVNNTIVTILNDLDTTV